VADGAIKDKLPTWVMAVVGGLISALVTVAGAGLTVWKNDSLHENQISALQDENRTTRHRLDQVVADNARLTGEVTRLKNSSEEFQTAAMDRLDEMLSLTHDRTRRR
jgi:hypothetical protein